MFFKKKEELDKNKLPQHIAFIIDGNGRWAKKRMLPRLVGHTYGMKAVKAIVKDCFDLGIKTVSIFGFSTENWNRPKEEVDHLMDLFREYIAKDAKEIYEAGAKINVLGELSRFPNDLQKSISEFTKKTKTNTKHVVNLCINYGGRDEIIYAVNNVLKSGKKSVTKEEFSKFLYTEDQPDPDFIIRTSGEQRSSNFMPWQAVYAEWYYPKIYWPDFNKDQLIKALIEFQGRNRRFGAIKEEVAVKNI